MRPDEAHWNLARVFKSANGLVDQNRAHSLKVNESTGATIVIYSKVQKSHRMNYDISIYIQFMVHKTKLKPIV